MYLGQFRLLCYSYIINLESIDLAGSVGPTYRPVAGQLFWTPPAFGNGWSLFVRSDNFRHCEFWNQISIVRFSNQRHSELRRSTSFGYFGFTGWFKGHLYSLPFLDQEAESIMFQAEDLLRSLSWRLFTAHVVSLQQSRESCEAVVEGFCHFCCELVEFHFHGIVLTEAESVKVWVAWEKLVRSPCPFRWYFLSMGVLERNILKEFAESSWIIQNKTKNIPKLLTSSYIYLPSGDLTGISHTNRWHPVDPSGLPHGGARNLALAPQVALNGTGWAPPPSSTSGLEAINLGAAIGQNFAQSLRNPNRKKKVTKTLKRYWFHLLKDIQMKGL